MWCYIAEGYYKIIWFYQLKWSCKLATITSFEHFPTSFVSTCWYQVVNWPPWRISKEDVSSASQPFVRAKIERHTYSFRTTWGMCHWALGFYFLLLFFSVSSCVTLTLWLLELINTKFLPIISIHYPINRWWEKSNLSGTFRCTLI